MDRGRTTAERKRATRSKSLVLAIHGAPFHFSPAGLDVKRVVCGALNPPGMENRMHGIEIPPNLDREAFAKKAMSIYDQKCRIQMEASMRGKVVAIEIESEEAFPGRTALEAAMKARVKYPNRFLYFVRVGYPAVHSQKGAGRLISAR